jgi:hypothetical protein
MLVHGRVLVLEITDDIHTRWSNAKRGTLPGTATGTRHVTTNALPCVLTLCVRRFCAFRASHASPHDDLHSSSTIRKKS